MGSVQSQTQQGGESRVPAIPALWGFQMCEGVEVLLGTLPRSGLGPRALPCRPAGISQALPAHWEALGRGEGGAGAEPRQGRGEGGRLESAR